VCVCVRVRVHVRAVIKVLGRTPASLSNTNALVASKGMQAVKLCTNKIIQFLTGSGS